MGFIITKIPLLGGEGGARKRVDTELIYRTPNAAAVTDALPTERMLVLLECREVNATVGSL
jgi:hypothetical protein